MIISKHKSCTATHLHTINILLCHISQILQLLLHHMDHPDHNVVTASLEALQQMLKHPHPALLHMLLTEGGVTKTYIFQADFQEAELRAESESSGVLGISPFIVWCLFLKYCLKVSSFCSRWPHSV